MAENTVIPGYEVGKEYKTITYGQTLAWAFYVGAMFPLAIMALPLPTTPNPVGVLVMSAVLLAGGVALTVGHNRSPQRKFTVLRTFKNADNSDSAEIGYLDGTTVIRKVTPDNGDGFWKQLGGLSKATFTGR